MNKKGEGEMIFLFIGLLLILGLYSSIENSNPYKTYMKDCKKLYKDDFKINETFDERNWLEINNNTEPRYYESEVTNKKELEKYCLGKYSQEFAFEVGVEE